jgi:osmotically inducible protein OsmC
MPTRTSRTAWNGSLETGEGQVELSSSKLGTYDVSFPKRAADDANGDVSLGPDSAGGFKLTGIALTVRGEVSGIDEAQFQAAAKDAKETCPVSKALTGVEITLDATFEG